MERIKKGKPGAVDLVAECLHNVATSDILYVYIHKPGECTE